MLHQTIYDDPTTSDIPLSTVLVNLKLTDQDGVLLTLLADATRVLEPASLITAGIVMVTCAVRRNRIRLSPLRISGDNPRIDQSRSHCWTAESSLIAVELVSAQPATREHVDRYEREHDQ